MNNIVKNRAFLWLFIATISASINAEPSVEDNIIACINPGYNKEFLENPLHDIKNSTINAETLQDIINAFVYTQHLLLKSNTPLNIWTKLLTLYEDSLAYFVQQLKTRRKSIGLQPSEKNLLTPFSGLLQTMIPLILSSDDFEKLSDHNRRQENLYALISRLENLLTPVEQKDNVKPEEISEESRLQAKLMQLMYEFKAAPNGEEREKVFNELLDLMTEAGRETIKNFTISLFALVHKDKLLSLDDFLETSGIVAAGLNLEIEELEKAHVSLSKRQDRALQTSMSAALSSYIAAVKQYVRYEHFEKEDLFLIFDVLLRITALELVYAIKGKKMLQTTLGKLQSILSYLFNQKLSLYADEDEYKAPSEFYETLKNTIEAYWQSLKKTTAKNDTSVAPQTQPTQNISQEEQAAPAPTTGGAARRGGPAAPPAPDLSNVFNTGTSTTQGADNINSLIEDIQKGVVLNKIEATEKTKPETTDSHEKLMDSIRQGTALKKVEPESAEKAKPETTDPHEKLLESIRQGATLKKVDQSTSNKPGLTQATRELSPFEQQLLARRQAIAGDTEASSADDDEWND